MLLPTTLIVTLGKPQTIEDVGLKVPRIECRPIRFTSCAKDQACLDGAEKHLSREGQICVMARGPNQRLLRQLLLPQMLPR